MNIFFYADVDDTLAKFSNNDVYRMLSVGDILGSTYKHGNRGKDKTSFDPNKCFYLLDNTLEDFYKGLGYIIFRKFEVSQFI